jgi:hypothetical protein
VLGIESKAKKSRTHEKGEGEVNAGKELQAQFSSN